MPRLSFPLVLVSLCGALAAQVGYVTDFEGLTASPSGTPLTGQDGFFVPAVAGSLDNFAWTYAGNALGVAANPNGGANFIGASSLGATTPARSQRAVTLPTSARVRIDFDVCADYLVSATAPTNNIGSLSLQPSGTSVHLILLARWPLVTPIPNPPTVWNADLVVGPTALGAQVSFPDPNFQNLAVNTWHRWGCTIDLVTNEYTEFRITNGTTSVTTTYAPLAGAMPLVNPTGTFPTEFRLFTGGGLGNVLAIDNLVISYSGEMTNYGAGCLGALGIPSLQAGPGTRPTIGTTFVAQFGNLPLSSVIACAGFSDTTYGGSLPLPADLGQFGLPGCSLHTDIVANTLLIGSGNTAGWNLAIPSNSTWIGTFVYLQGFSLDPTANPGGAALTPGGKMVVGY